MLDKLPGLYTETRPSGEVRHRVRPSDGSKKITLQVGPDHPQFREHYHAARSGIQLTATAGAGAGDTAVRGSVGWLIDKYAKALGQLVDAGRLQARTVQCRMVQLNWLRSEAGETFADMPRGQVMQLRDKLIKTPGTADNFLKAVRAMYLWAIPREFAKGNPTAGIERLIRHPKGATPWTEADLDQYLERHPKGTNAHLAISLFMFTACRISDVIRLGRQHESTINGVTRIAWQPAKRGSSFVNIAMEPALYEATRAVKVVGSTYLLTEAGKPFSTTTGFGNAFRDWVLQAGLVGKDGKVTRSPHGIRKASGGFMAEGGASLYEIMAVMGHSSPATSAVYTRGAERAKLGDSGLGRMGTLGERWNDKKGKIPALSSLAGETFL